MLSRVVAFIILIIALKVLFPHAFASVEHVVAMFFDAISEPGAFRVDNVATSAYNMNTAGYFPQAAQLPTR